MDNVFVENGDLNISYANVMHFMDVYGKLIGAIHAVCPCEVINPSTKETSQQIQHITQFFFSKGYVHTALGFMIGHQTNQESMYRVIGLKTVLDMIPSSPTIDMVESPTMDHMLKITVEDQIKSPIFYVVRTPERAIIPNITKSRGYYAMEECLAVLKDDKEKIIYLGEDENNAQS